MTKQALRKQYLEKRKNLKEFDLQVLSQFLKEYKSIALFYSFDDEIDVKPLFDKFKDKTILLPFCSFDITFRKYISEEDLVLDKYHIPAPSSNEVPISSIDVIVTPAVVMNYEGYRVGYGKALYDKALKNYKGIKVGLIHSSFIVNEAFQEEHDVKMDFIITEKEIIKVD